MIASGGDRGNGMHPRIAPWVALISWIGLAAPPAFAASTNPAGAILSRVCIPLMEGRGSEADLTRKAHLRMDNGPWFPQAHPKGLNQYVGAPGVSVVNITNDTCLIHVAEGNLDAISRDFLLQTSARGWRRIPHSIFGPQTYCNPAGAVAASVEVNPDGRGLDLLVTRRGHPCGD